MISGRINSELESEISLEVVGPLGIQQRIQFVVDTGYNGFLTIPSGIVDLLSLTWLGRDRATLADGRTTYFDVYRGVIVWDGIPRIIELEASDSTPLIGTSLLHRHKVEMEFVDGGSVTISALP